MTELPLKGPAREVRCSPGDVPACVYDADAPVVLRGLINHWPAVAECQSIKDAREYLSNFWSKEPVVAYIGAPDIDGRFGYTDDLTGFNFQRGRAPLAFICDKLAEQPAEDGESIYVGSTPVDRWLPGFRKTNDVSVPSDDALVSFWLGNRTRISAHFDFPDNLACVVAGRRRFTLFPPEQVGNLYVGPLDDTPSGQAISLVDVNKPDLSRFPRFADAMAAALYCELEPGDALFLPSMWWHNVESLEDFNLLVNYWWIATPAVMGVPDQALKQAMLSVRALPPRQRAAWKALFDHYVFDADETVFSHIPEHSRGSLAPLTDATARKLRQELLNRLNQ